MSEKECSICCELIKGDDNNMGRLKCCHEFHIKCIKKWLDKNPTCPNCRTKVKAIFVNDGTKIKIDKEDHVSKLLPMINTPGIFDESIANFIYSNSEPVSLPEDVYKTNSLTIKNDTPHNSLKIGDIVKLKWPEYSKPDEYKPYMDTISEPNWILSKETEYVILDEMAYLPKEVYSRQIRPCIYTHASGINMFLTTKK